MKQVLMLFRLEGVAFLAAITLAFSLFQALEPFLDFCNWIQPLVYHWRLYVYKFFDLVFFWLPFFVPSALKDMFALGLLILLIILRTRRQVAHFREGADLEQRELADLKKNLGWFSRTLLISAGLVALIFLFPVFGWTEVTVQPSAGFGESINALLGFAPMFFRTFIFAGVMGLILFTKDNGDVIDFRGFASKHMWRVVTVFFTFFTLNWVGLYSDSIRDFKDNPILLKSSAILSSTNPS